MSASRPTTPPTPVCPPHPGAVRAPRRARLAALALALLGWTAALTSAAAAQTGAEFAAAERGFALLDDRRPVQARLFFEELLAASPDSLPARVGWARTLRGAQRAEHVAALRDAASAARPDADALAVLLELGYGDLRTGIGWAQLRELRAEDPFAALAAARSLAREGAGSLLSTWEVVRQAGYLASVRRAPIPLPGAAREVFAELFARYPETLYFQYVLAREYPLLEARDLFGLRAAAEALPDSPLAPQILVRCAEYMDDLPARWALLLEVEGRWPQSSAWDDARYARAQMLPILHASQRRQAIELLEPIVDLGEGSQWHAAAQDLLGLYVSEDRAQEAHRLLVRLEAEGLRHHPEAVAVLRAVGLLEAAEERARAWLEATGPEPGTHSGRAHWALGEILLESGRPREALTAFDAAREGGAGSGLGERLTFLRALVLAYPFPCVGGALFLLLGWIAMGLAAVIFAGRFRRVRPGLPVALGLALAATLPSAASRLVGGAPFGAVDAGSLLYVAVRNTLLASAACALLPLAGIPRGPWLRRARVRRAQLPAALARIALAVGAMFAITRGLFALARPQPGEFFQRLANLMRDSEFAVLLEADSRGLEALLLAAGAAIQEELLFRFFWLAVLLVGLRRLAAEQGLGQRDRPARVLAVLLTALLFALPHAGMVDPEWVKLVQVTALGCVLGWLALRQGPGSALLAHLAFNTAAILLP